MCLGLPCQLVELRPERSALVRSERRTLTVSLLTLPDEVAPGDWVLVHSGYALARLTAQEAGEALTVRTGGAEGST
ncbi:MAG TPA: HypC/HybG/HupF family hydrogenase formation chaperone [Jiangellales bacterium]|nr:HypC/HybG/HupF family hydrogenase formation chaperone [Jiangellales bacterium]